MNKQQGFTLIELVMVIVILGILAATAMPKFSNMQSDARKAAIKGAAGAINSAMAIAHAQALINSQTGATGTVTLDGASVNLVYGYPAGATGGIDTAVTISGDLSAWTFAAGVATLNFTTAVASCSVAYTQASSAAVPPTVQSTLTC